MQWVVKKHNDAEGGKKEKMVLIHTQKMSREKKSKAEFKKGHR